MFAELPAKVCSVNGPMIREKIREHMEKLRRAIPTIEHAISTRREGVDWHCMLDSMKLSLRACEATLPAIGDGPHLMSIDQWIEICNRFGDVNDADKILKSVQDRAAHMAAHKKPETTVAS